MTHPASILSAIWSKSKSKPTRAGAGSRAGAPAGGSAAANTGSIGRTVAGRDDRDMQNLLVATADRSHAALDANVQKVLSILRKNMNMDVVFVAKFEHGKRVFKVVDAPFGIGRLLTGYSEPLEDSMCWQIAHGRMPQFMRDCAAEAAAGRARRHIVPIRTHLTVPVVLEDGSIYGTVCAFSLRVNQGASMRDLWRMRAVADAIAKRVQPGAPGSAGASLR